MTKWILLMDGKPAIRSDYRKEGEMIFFARVAYRGRGIKKTSIFETEAEARKIINAAKATRRRKGWNNDFYYQVMPIEL